MYLKKANGTIDRHTLRLMPRVYGYMMRTEEQGMNRRVLISEASAREL